MFSSSEGRVRGGLCETRRRGRVHPRGRGRGASFWGGCPSRGGGGARNARDLHTGPFGMCFRVKGLNYPQRKDNAVRFLAAGVCIHSRCRSPSDMAPPGLGGAWAAFGCVTGMQIGK